MNNKVNYGWIGFLVLLGFSLIAGFSYWMLKPSVKDDMQKYTIYFNESVLGLNLDAPVKYRGISVGKVTQMQINPQNSEQIEVTVDILKTTPIKVDTVAKLTAQGITGLSYINLSMGAHLAKKLSVTKGEKYPVIKTAPSFFEHFEQSLGDVSSQLSATLGRTEELLGADNQHQMSLLLERTATMMGQVQKLLDDATVAHLQSSIKNLDEFTSELNQLMPKVHHFLEKTQAWESNTSASIDSIMESYLGLDKSMKGIEEAFFAGEKEFKTMNSEILPTLNMTFVQMQELMIKLSETLEHYNESPSDLLYKREEIKKAPGED